MMSKWETHICSILQSATASNKLTSLSCPQFAILMAQPKHWVCAHLSEGRRAPVLGSAILMRDDSRLDLVTWKIFPASIFFPSSSFSPPLWKDRPPSCLLKPLHIPPWDFLASPHSLSLFLLSSSTMVIMALIIIAMMTISPPQLPFKVPVCVMLVWWREKRENESRFLIRAVNHERVKTQTYNSRKQTSEREREAHLVWLTHSLCECVKMAAIFSWVCEGKKLSLFQKWLSVWGKEGVNHGCRFSALNFLTFQGTHHNSIVPGCAPAHSTTSLFFELDDLKMKPIYC